MRTCPEALCADCHKRFRPWGASNLCLACYGKTVEKIAQSEEYERALLNPDLYGGEL